MDNKIGFRIKINIDSVNLNVKEIESNFKNYYRKFEVLELKLNKNLISSGCLIKIVETCQNICDKDISLHLPSDLIYNKANLKANDELFHVLNQVKFNKNTRLITHLPKYINENTLADDIENLSFKMPKNTILLLENPDDCGNTLEYMKKINSLFHILKNIRNNRTFFCLDFGHLFYNALKDKIEIVKILNILEDNTAIIENIKEIHIHDFDFEKDHIALGQGLISIKKIVTFLKKNNINSPIIIEVTLDSVLSEGQKQVDIIRQSY